MSGAPVFVTALPLTADESRRLSAMLEEQQAIAVNESIRLQTARRAPNAVTLLNAAATFCADLRERMMV